MTTSSTWRIIISPIRDKYAISSPQERYLYLVMDYYETSLQIMLK